MRLSLSRVLFHILLISFVLTITAGQMMDRGKRADITQEDVDATRAALDRRPKVPRPAYRLGPLPDDVIEREEAPLRKKPKKKKKKRLRKGKKSGPMKSRKASRKSRVERAGQEGRPEVIRADIYDQGSKERTRPTFEWSRDLIG